MFYLRTGGMHLLIHFTRRDQKTSTNYKSVLLTPMMPKSRDKKRAVQIHIHFRPIYKSSLVLLKLVECLLALRSISTCTLLAQKLTSIGPWEHWCPMSNIEAFLICRTTSFLTSDLTGPAYFDYKDVVISQRRMSEW